MRFVVDSDTSERLDVVLTKQLPDLSRSSVQKLIDQCKVQVNDEVQIRKYKVKPGDIVKLDFDTEQAMTIPDISLEVIYEDDDCLVINKPVGILSHSKGAFNPEATVATFIQSRLTDLAGDRGGIVHRLDRVTSGVMICAKNPEALAWLQKQFSQRRVKKTYYAIVAGHLTPSTAVIDMPIERHPKMPKMFRTGLQGKSATTQYEVVSSSAGHDLVKLQPQTGRTHQLRVHMRQMKHPIVGDVLYEGEAAERLYLHAETLEITLPSRERKVFNVPLPPEFNKFMQND